MILLGVLSASARKGLWTPNDLTVKPWAWYDASDGSTMTYDTSSRVSDWRSKGRLPANATLRETDPGYQPVLTASAAANNAKPALTFASGAVMRTAGNTDITEGESSSSIFAVARVASTTSEQIVISTGLSTDATQNVRTLVIRNGTACIDFAGGSRFQGTGPALTVPQIVGFKVEQDGAQVTSVWANGTNGGNNFRSSPRGGKLTLGQMPYYTPNPATDAMQEIVLLDYHLGTTEQQMLEGYLAWKWGTVSLLPSGHPFKSAAPTA